MKLKKFKTFSYEIQAELTWEKGTYLASRSDNDYMVILFGLFNFFVEIYIREESKLIENIDSFHSPDKLDPYLDRFDIVKVMS